MDRPMLEFKKALNPEWKVCGSYARIDVKNSM